GGGGPGGARGRTPVAHPPTATATTWDYRGNGHPLAQTSRSWLIDAPTEVIDSRFHAIVTDLVGTPTELVTPDGRIAWHQTTSLWGERRAGAPGGGGARPPPVPRPDDEPGSRPPPTPHPSYTPAPPR